MKILVFGSLNIDKVYSMPHLPQKGETLTADNYEIHVGGKGLNQAVSCQKAGNEVYMAGKIGNDGTFLADFLRENGVNTNLLLKSANATGHAVIEVDKTGQNQMILFSGTNREITETECDAFLSHFSAGDMVLMQYETSCVEYMLKKAKEKGLYTAFNPSPFTNELKNIDFAGIDFLILNEEEGLRLSDEETAIKAARCLQKRTGGKIILTIGADGAVYCDEQSLFTVPAYKVEAVDTTGAGDTFTGYVLTSLLKGEAPQTALKTASAASALAVTRFGAAGSIPDKTEVSVFLRKSDGFRALNESAVTSFPFYSH